MQIDLFCMPFLRCGPSLVTTARSQLVILEMFRLKPMEIHQILMLFHQGNKLLQTLAENKFYLWNMVNVNVKFHMGGSILLLKNRTLIRKKKDGWRLFLNK